MEIDELIVKLKEIISHVEEFEECRKHNTIDQLIFEAMEEYHLFKQKESQPTEIAIDCNHESISQKQIRCSVCERCGEIIEVDV